MAWAGTFFYVCFSAHRDSTGSFILLQYSSGCLTPLGFPGVSTRPHFCLLYLVVAHNNSCVYELTTFTQVEHKYVFYHSGNRGRGLGSRKASLCPLPLIPDPSIFLLTVPRRYFHHHENMPI